MRSHPYAPAPPLPPLLDHLSTYLPNAAGPRRPATAVTTTDDDDDASAIALADLDPATSRLLPRRRHAHRVRVQGRLAVVRSVSVANLRGLGSPRTSSSSLSSSSGRLPRPPHSSDGVAAPSHRRRRRQPRTRSLLDPDGGASDDDDEAGREVRRKDAQLRSYGIGGAGNIRRPTDVIGTSTREPSVLASLFSSSSARSDAMPEGKRRHWIGFLGRVGDRKGKDKA